MKKTAFVILCVFSALMLTTCKKMPELKVYDLKLTSENVAYSQTSAEIKVEYDYPTNLEYVNVTMSESNYFGYSIVAQSEIIDSVFIANFVDLHTDKKYYYKFEYSNGVNVVTSEVHSFYLDAALVTLPTVITKEITEITGTSAKCGGEIIDDGGYYVTGRGVCWSTHRNPTIFDSYTTDGMNTGSYTSIMTGLSEHTVYYVRAFAINEKGTSYGTEYSFETTTGGGGGGGTAPTGAINGLFTINENGDQIYFSQGNLQYQASTKIWRFAENQWDYVGSDNANVSSSYNGWIDLFAYGTSGYLHGATSYQPWSTSLNYSDYYAYGNASYNLNDQTGKADWGYNAISNGGNTENIWRTLTKSEWSYLLETRETDSHIRYAKTVLDGIKGLIILPDDWSTAIFRFNSTNSPTASFASNTITIQQWSNTLEANGAVFLPAAGIRDGTHMEWVGEHGRYWSTDNDSYTHTYGTFFSNTEFYTDGWLWRYYCQCVRLVQDAQ